jgi:hypothetical protein
MQRLPSQYLAYALILTLVGSVFSIVLPSNQPSYASHENITVNVSGDDVTDTYDPSDTVVIAGNIDQLEAGQDVTLKFKDPTGSTKKTQDVTPDEDDGYFDYSYDIPSTGKDGVWTVETEYNNEKMYTYFIVDGEDDTIIVELDSNDGIYEAGDEVTISGQVDNPDGSEPNVVITVLDPTNDEIVNQDEAELGDGSLDADEFEYSFDLENDASHGRYAVKVTYDIDDQEGSTLFEILDSGSGSDFSGDSDSDGDLSAQIEKDTYEPGDNVAIEGSIDNYDSGDNEDLGVVVEDPNGDEVDDYGDDSATVKSSGDFTYDFDLADDADEGTYAVTMSYAGDEITMTFKVGSGTSGGGTSSSDLTVKLNKSSYLAGDAMTVSGTVKHVAPASDEEVVSILLYEPDGKVVLSASKYVTPSSSGAYSATILIPSSLEADEDYKIVVAYLDDEMQTKFDITGVSSTPSDKITVKTDKTQYSVGNTVKISGDVPDVLIVEDQQLLIRVNTPDGNPCRLDPIEVPSSGAFTYDLVLGGKCGLTGEYDVEVTYNGEKSKTTFVLAGSGMSVYGLKAAGKTYSIEYGITSGSLNSIFARPDENKLVLNINAQDDGKLTLVLPREVIDAIENGKDINYIVTIEDESGNISTVQADETDNTDDARTLEIDYVGGAARIEITGTQVVPEFGAIAAIVMATAIVGIIAATSRFGNKFSLFGQ